jgi:putative Mg2+ transporter-C (MgtC) family protein
MWDIAVPARLALALLLSGLIGFEREAGGKPAGMRTHMLVCMGSTLFMLISMNAPGFFPGATTVDPGRIAAQVVTGVGFLGAGTIIRAGGSVRGLTTAASIWAVSAIGLAVGVGYYMAAVVATALALAVLHLPDVVLGWTGINARSTGLRVVCAQGEGRLELIERTLKKRKGRVEFVDVGRRGDELHISYRLAIEPKRIHDLVSALSNLEGVHQVTME